MIGLSKDIVRIEKYRKEWISYFEKEADLIYNSISNIELIIEHIGSTAIPELASKPIIDIMIGTKTIDEAKACISQLQKIGYLYKGELGIPNRLFFVKGDEQKRTHHVHLVTIDSEFWEDHILFRDYLIKYKQVKDKYERLKRKLAKKYSSERENYTNSKTDFILDIVAKAKNEE